MSNQDSMHGKKTLISIFEFDRVEISALFFYFRCHNPMDKEYACIKNREGNGGQMDKGMDTIINKIPENFKKAISMLPREAREEIEEIRIKCQTDTLVISGGKEFKLSDKEIMTPEMLEDILNRLLDYSYYAYENELSNGYITMEGGHRVGICGRVTLRDDKVHLIKNVSSLNIRRSREIVGAADSIMNIIVSNDGRVSNTLIISPPKCGKTTILRDIARNLSHRGYRIGICDERSELAGCFNGIPTYDIGPRTDILDGCPKAQGMIMLIRAMAPDVIITDEIGKREDINSIEEASGAGIKIITSIHGNDYEDVKASSMGALLKNRTFENLIFLSSDPKTGTIKKVMRISSGTEKSK